MTTGFFNLNAVGPGIDKDRDEEDRKFVTKRKTTVLSGREMIGTIPDAFQNGLFRNEIVIELTRELCEFLFSVMIEAENYKNGLNDPKVGDPSALTAEAKKRRYEKFLARLVDMRPTEFDPRYQKFLKVNNDRPLRFYSMLINSYVAHVYKASSKSRHRHSSIVPLKYPKLEEFVKFFLKRAAREPAIAFNVWPRCNPTDWLLVTENAIRKSLYEDVTNNLSVEYVTEVREEESSSERRRRHRKREETKEPEPSVAKDKEPSVAKDKEPAIREEIKEPSITRPKEALKEPSFGPKEQLRIPIYQPDLPVVAVTHDRPASTQRPKTTPVPKDDERSKRSEAKKPPPSIQKPKSPVAKVQTVIPPLVDPGDLQASAEVDEPKPDQTTVTTIRQNGVTFNIEVSPSPIVQKPPSVKTETSGYVRPNTNTPSRPDDVSARSNRSSASSKKKESSSNQNEAS